MSPQGRRARAPAWDFGDGLEEFSDQERNQEFLRAVVKLQRVQRPVKPAPPSPRRPVSEPRAPITAWLSSCCPHTDALSLAIVALHSPPSTSPISLTSLTLPVRRTCLATDALDTRRLLAGSRHSCLFFRPQAYRLRAYVYRHFGPELFVDSKGISSSAPAP